MTKRFFKLLGLLAVLVALCALCFCSGAMAEPAIALNVANGVLDDTGAYGGSYYYKVYIDLTDATTCQMGWTTDEEADGPDWWDDVELNDYRLNHDDGGYYLVSWSNDEGRPFDALFARVDEESDPVKVAFRYDFSVEDPSVKTAITNTDAPTLFEPFTIGWNALDGVDQYMIYWYMPNGQMWIFRSCGTST